MLRVRAPSGILTAALRAEITAAKVELLRLVDPRSYPCASCGSRAFVFPSPATRCYWCRQREGRVA